MHALSLIRKKRAGSEHSATEIEWLVQASLRGEVPDYQLAAWLMAVNYEHLSLDETVALTHAFVDSGETLDWGLSDAPLVDKHSTGGVGDKVSLLLTPWLAAAGFRVAKMSGRGLGHTGGTIDKLESIPGFRTDLSREEAQRILDDVGCVIMQQTGRIVPADKQWYALRDVTDTVGELGLIAASVMSKKIACGAPYIVLDVKCGSGAFFKTLGEARAFAELSRRIGEQFGRKVACVVSSMDQPLGEAIGNAIEVLEVLQVVELAQHGRVDFGVSQPVVDLSATLAGCCEVMAGYAEPTTDPVRFTELVVDSLPMLFSRFERWIAAQGGDTLAFFKLYADYFASAGHLVVAEASGSVQSIDTARLGSILGGLGAGRSVADASIDPRVGLLCHGKIGQHVEAGQPLATLFMGKSRADLVATQADLRSCFALGPERAAAWPLILDVLI